MKVSQGIHYWLEYQMRKYINPLTEGFNAPR